jgi:ABC-type cobalamin/Fe3+-siderophores transport system ATPase subunit
MHYADEIILLHQGHILAQGVPAQVLTELTLAQVFGIKAEKFELASGKTQFSFHQALGDINHV